MKRCWVSVLLSFSLAICGSLPTSYAAPKTGSSCTKLGKKTTTAGYLYTCIKSGKKLVWSKGVKVLIDKEVVPTPSSSPAASPVVIDTPSPSPSAAPIVSQSPIPQVSIDTSQIYVSPSPPSTTSTQFVPKLALLATTFNSITFQIENYDSSFNWRVEPSDGYASRDAKGKVVVTGLKPNSIYSVRVTAARPTYKDGFETISAETAPESDALTPMLLVLGETSQDFYVKIENYDPKFTWSIQATKGIIETKLPDVFRIYGYGVLTEPVFVTVFSSRAGFKSGKAIAIKNK
ncbi:hypothetical protein MCEMRE217_00053 [Candidatus Nanopelagicaceae bacterium]